MVFSVLAWTVISVVWRNLCNSKGFSNFFLSTYMSVCVTWAQLIKNKALKIDWLCDWFGLVLQLNISGITEIFKNFIVKDSDNGDGTLQCEYRLWLRKKLTGNVLLLKNVAIWGPLSLKGRSILESAAELWKTTLYNFILCCQFTGAVIDYGQGRAV